MSKNLADAPMALTYDDVLLVPKRSSVKSRKDVSVKTKFSKNITLNIPIVASNMDTVTEVSMAVTMANHGGIGIIHRFNSIADQCKMVKKVKRARTFKISDPYFILDSFTRQQVEDEFNLREVSNLVVYSNAESKKFVGIMNRKDLRYSPKSEIKDLITPLSKLIKTTDRNISLHEAGRLMSQSRLPVLPILEGEVLISIITDKDVHSLNSFPDAVLDNHGRLLVGAAIGVKGEDMERARELAKAEVDCLVVDIAHGHSDLAIDITKQLKADPITRKVDIVVGNICTAEGAKDLIAAGADSLKVGVGPGSICITRKVAGAGYPQLSALWEVAQVARKAGVPIIADGGVRLSGDIAKAIAVGADTVMLGNLLAGTDESPGIVITKEGRKVKIIRGMAGYGANLNKDDKAKSLKSTAENDAFDLVPEGVEAVVQYKGPVGDILKQLVGGLKSGVSYCGANTLDSMRKNAEFVRITPSGLIESGSHDVAKI